MKWVTLIFILLFNTAGSYGQSKNKSFKFFFAPSFVYSDLYETNAAFAEFVDLRNDNDNAKGGIYLGILYEKDIRGIISLQTGVTASLLQITSGQRVTNGDHQADNPLRIGYFYTQEFYHAGIPLNVKKSLFFSKDRSFSFYTLAGAELNYLWSGAFNRSYILSNGDIEDTTNEFESNLKNRNFNVAGAMGIGVTYTLDNIIIFIQPTARSFLLNQWKTGLKEHITSFNLIMGISF